ncbi:MAG: hypothetical protein FJ102_07410 [Deltaproteobacteria bacterium]|nr:hypothetical protein [Deltaproteobacteria bacterium]
MTRFLAPTLLLVSGAVLAQSLDEAVQLRVDVATRLESVDASAAFGERSAEERFRALARAMSPEARAALLRMVDEHVLPVPVDVEPPAPLPAASEAAPRPDCDEITAARARAPNDPGLSRAHDMCWAGLQTRINSWEIERATLPAARAELEARHAAAMAEWREASARARSAPADVMDALWQMPLLPSLVVFDVNGTRLDKAATAQVLAFAQAIALPHRLEQGVALVVAYASPTREVQAGANEFMPVARGDAVQSLLLQVSSPIRAQVIHAPVDAPFVVRWTTEKTPNYYRSKAARAVAAGLPGDGDPSWVERQAVLMVWLDNRFIAAIRDPSLEFVAAGSQRDPAEPDVERRILGASSGERNALMDLRQREREAQAVDVCSAVSAADRRLVGAVNGWSYGATVAMGGGRVYADAESVFSPETLARGVSQPRVYTRTFPDSASLGELEQWIVAGLAGVADQFFPAIMDAPSTVAAPIALFRRGPRPEGVDIRLVVEDHDSYEGQFDLDVRDARAEVGLRALADALLGEGRDRSTSRSGAVSFRDHRPAVVSGQARFAAQVSARTTHASDVGLARAASFRLQQGSDLWLAELSPLRVARDPLYGNLELTAESADVDEWSDTDSGDELDRAWRYVEEGLFGDLGTALQQVGASTPTASCIRQVLGTPGGP